MCRVAVWATIPQKSHEEGRKGTRCPTTTNKKSPPVTWCVLTALAEATDRNRPTDAAPPFGGSLRTASLTRQSRLYFLFVPSPSLANIVSAVSFLPQLPPSPSSLC